MGANRVALFDLDHTLLPIDSDYAWGQFTTSIGWTDAVEFARRNEAFYVQYQAGTLQIAEYVRFATAAFCQAGATKSIAAHSLFMQAVVDKSIKPAALELLARHRAAGDTLVVVTATNEFVVRPIVAALGVQELIAVELERDESPDGTGWFTGEIKGVPSMRGGKVTRVEAWLAARGLTWSDADTTFYSDSMNDLPLLERVNHPVATNPDDRLRAVALERGWRILELFAKE